MFHCMQAKNIQVKIFDKIIINSFLICILWIFITLVIETIFHGKYKTSVKFKTKLYSKNKNKNTEFTVILFSVYILWV